MTDASPEAGATAGGEPVAAAVNPFGDVFRKIGQRGDIALALGIVAILVVLLLPMPTWMLDFSLAISITFSVLILIRCCSSRNRSSSTPSRPSC